MKLTILLITLLTFSCCTKVVYQVSTLKHPALGESKIDSAKYSLVKDSLQNEKLMELNLLKIIKTELDNKGWVETDIENADFIFSIKFEMESGQESGSRTVMVYDYKTQKNVPQQKAYTSTIYKRNVVINLFDKNSKDVPMWSADCISEGSTNDIYFASTYMLPFAISVLPNQGNWNRQEFLKKKPRK